jgi:hypothetical protein
MNKKIIAMLLITVLIITILGSIYFFNQKEPEKEIIINESQVSLFINELRYNSNQNFIEIIIESTENSTIGFLNLNISGTLFQLPEITEVKNNTYLVIYFSEGIENLDASKGIINIYLSDGQPLNKNTGYIKLGSVNGKLYDFLTWNNYNYAIEQNIWFSNSNEMKQNTGESLQLFGDKINSSANWLSSYPTPGLRNALQFYAPKLQTTFVIENGDSILPFISVDEDIRFRANITDVQVLNSTGRPVNATIISLLQEMVNFTAHYYADLGFPAPLNFSDGKIYIIAQNGTEGASTGGARSNGVIVVKVGTNWNKVELKLTVEHEMMHLVQWNRTKNSDNETIDNMPDPPNTNNWWEEGMAEYWGTRSAMANYNISMAEVQMACQVVGSANWWDYGRLLNTSTFSNWGHSWNDYTIGMLFIKYLVETYGQDIVQQIQRNMSNNHNNATKSISAQQALEKVLNTTLQKIIEDFYLWRVFDREGGDLPVITLSDSIIIGNKENNSLLFNKTIIDSSPQGGAVVEFYDFNGTKPVQLNFTNANGLGNWSIKVKVAYTNGSSEIITLQSNGTNSIVINPDLVDNVTLIKVKMIDGVNSNLNVSIRELPGTSPDTALKLPFNIPKLFELPFYDYWSIFLDFNLIAGATYNFTLGAFPGIDFTFFTIYNLTNISEILFISSELPPNSSPYRTYLFTPNLSGDYYVKIELTELSLGSVPIEIIVNQ